MPALLDAVLPHRADVLVLTEYRNNAASTLLREGLAAAGYAHQLASGDGPRVNYLLVAARQPLRPLRLRPLTFDRQRLLAVETQGLRVVAAHLPNLRAKLPHWAALLRVAAARPHAPTVYLGDFNTGHARHDVERGPYPIHGAAEMATLLDRGWVDAWRQSHPDGREYSWYSHRDRGFRLDHAFLSPACAPRLRSARFDHGVRERGATDHSALIVDLAEGPAT